jgi:hypothetical protein
MLAYYRFLAPLRPALLLLLCSPLSSLCSLLWNSTLAVYASGFRDPSLYIFAGLAVVTFGGLKWLLSEQAAESQRHQAASNEKQLSSARSSSSNNSTPTKKQKKKGAAAKKAAQQKAAQRSAARAAKLGYQPVATLTQRKNAVAAKSEDDSAQSADKDDALPMPVTKKEAGSSVTHENPFSVLSDATA